MGNIILIPQCHVQITALPISLKSLFLFNFTKSTQLCCLQIFFSVSTYPQILFSNPILIFIHGDFNLYNLSPKIQSIQLHFKHPLLLPRAYILNCFISATVKFNILALGHNLLCTISLVQLTVTTHILQPQKDLQPSTN